MSLFDPRELELARAASALTYCNPFVPERMEGERRALGPEFQESGLVWRWRGDEEQANPNVERIGERVEALAEAVRDRLTAGRRGNPEEQSLYKDLVSYLLYYRFVAKLFRIVTRKVDPAGRIPFYPEFEADARRYFQVPGVRTGPVHEPAHLFACSFQVRRAFHYIYRYILGGSLAAARLRAAVWQSIFTHDMRRYRRALYRRLGDVTTLVTGPSGTGKELVARAIGLARYIPFDPGAQSFREDFETSFYPLNLSALSPTLIESELFGHRRGTFTGAVADRAGWLEVCPPLGTVFLDEIGEVDLAIQVKLLRVLQSRTFQRLGESKDRRFEGKVIAATNRDLAEEMAAGRFREDLYYRLCADLVVTPSLAEVLEGSPDELEHLVLYLAGRVAGEEEASAVAGEVMAWLNGELGRDYSWPGNFRELEQCVRNVLIRGSYRPQRAPAPEPGEALADQLAEGSLSAEDVLRIYVTTVYAQCGSYLEASRRLGLDRRTVKAKVDEDLLARLKEEGTG